MSPRTLFTHTHTLHKWTVEMQGNARIKNFPKSKAEQPPPSFTMVLSAKVNMRLRTLAKGQSTTQVCHLGLQQVQPMQSRKKAQGLQQLALLQEFTCVCTEISLHMTRSSWMEKECIEHLLCQPLMEIGRMLLQGDMQGCNKFPIVIVATAAAADGMLPQGLQYPLLHIKLTWTATRMNMKNMSSITCLGNFQGK